MLVKPDEFLAVRHRYLNRHDYELDRLVDETLELEKHTRRKIVPCLEGDLVQTDTGQIVFMHENYKPPKNFHRVYEKGYGIPLLDALDRIADYVSRTSNRLVLCIELKHFTSPKAMKEAMLTLEEYGLEAYFDSFFGHRLGVVERLNETLGTQFLRSWHLYHFSKRAYQKLKKYSRVVAPKDYDLLTTTTATDEPHIRGAVKSKRELEKIADDENVMGGYIRFKEKSRVRMIINSLFG
jgi:hypothetical protein